MTRSPIAAAWLTACFGGSPVRDDYPDVVAGTPAIASAEVSCDAEAARWTLEVVATAWTGGVETAWTTDGAYVELHALNRESWEPDGTGEVLSLRLAIADDWREVTDTSTAFTCAADPSGALALRDTDGRVVDCRAWGPAPELLAALPDAVACDVPITETPTR